VSQPPELQGMANLLRYDNLRDLSRPPSIAGYSPLHVVLMKKNEQGDEDEDEEGMGREWEWE
jgi:hypothetical protein